MQLGHTLLLLLIITYVNSLFVNITPIPASVIAGDSLTVTSTITKTDLETWKAFIFYVVDKGIYSACRGVPYLTNAACTDIFGCPYGFGFTCNYTHFNLLINNVDIQLLGLSIYAEVTITGSPKVISNTTTIEIKIPITSVTISNTPTDENPVKIIKGQGKVFTCKTNAGRPSSKIQWYLASVNITSSATTQSDVCATDCSDGKLISSSQLIYKGNTNDSGKIIYCTASNVEGHGIRSLNKTIDVLYLPNVHMEPIYNPYIVYHKQRDIVLTCVIDDANPSNDVKYKWNSPIGTVNTQNFTILTANYSHNGQYFCTATNIAGTSNETYKQISVQYGPFISNITQHQNIIEGNNLVVSPIVDANPVAKLIWWTRQNDTNFIYVGSVLRINNIDRIFSGNYSCYVMNTLTPSGMAEINSTTQKTFYVNVVFKPVLDHTIPYPPSHVSATENNTLHLTLTLNANPTPTIEWTFRAEADWNSCNFVRIVSNTSTNGFLTSSSILIENVQSSNFGEYVFAANNTVGTFLRRFIVMKEVACLTRENFPITKENHTGMFVAGIVTLVIGLMSLTAVVIFVVRNSLKNKALNSSKSVEYSDVQRSNPAFTDAYTTLQSNIESTVPLEQIINTYEECGKTPEAHTYSSVDKMESDPSQPQHHGVNTYEECGKRDEFEAHAYDTLDK